MSSDSKQLPYSTGKLSIDATSRCVDDFAPPTLNISSQTIRDRSTDSYASHLSRNTLTTVTPSDSRYEFADLTQRSVQFSHRHRRDEKSQDRIRPLKKTGKRSCSRSPKGHREANRRFRPREDTAHSISPPRPSSSSSRTFDKSRSPSKKRKHYHSEQYVPHNNDINTSSFQQVVVAHAAISHRPSRNPRFSDLPLEWWERHEKCKDAKEKHTSRIDHICSSREDLVLQTTLWGEETVLEPNLFPYETPPGVEHYTLWSKHDMSHEEIVYFVDNWLLKHFPQVRRWQYDDNFGERSVLLFHVHVFIEMKPFSFTPRPGQEYFPPHVNF